MFQKIVTYVKTRKTSQAEEQKISCKIWAQICLQHLEKTAHRFLALFQWGNGTKQFHTYTYQLSFYYHGETATVPSDIGSWLEGVNLHCLNWSMISDR